MLMDLTFKCLWFFVCIIEDVNGWSKNDEGCLFTGGGGEVVIEVLNLKGLAQAKIIKKSVILFWLLNMTI